MRKIVGYVCLAAGATGFMVAILVFGTQAAHEMAPYVPTYTALFLLAIVTLVAGTSLLIPATRSPIAGPMRPITWKWLAVGAMGIVVTVWCSIALLMHFANQAQDSNRRSELKFDALKTSLAVGAGSAGAVALVLGFRRQWLTERAQSHLEFDSSEQRVTNLYTKAADQLGHDNAAVRLAGLYAVERVAQNNPEHRQTIVDVLCAYLRMPLPYNPWSTREAEQYEESDREPPIEFAEAARSYDQELHVRDAAQTIIVKHLRFEDEGSENTGYFWPHLDLDLRGAYLRDFSLDGCRLRGANFAGATFHGGIFVVRTTFEGMPWGRQGPVGVGGVEFASCNFSGRVVFEQVTFLGDASFSGAKFRKDAFFGGVDFAGRADFESSTFRRAAAFEGSVFRDGAEFAEVTFGDVTFGEGYMFVSGAKFEGMEADFSDAHFDGSADFAGAIFSGTPIDSESAPNGTNFSGARARIGEDVSHVWPDGWRNGEEVESGYVALVRGTAPTPISNGGSESCAPADAGG